MDLILVDGQISALEAWSQDQAIEKALRSERESFDAETAAAETAAMEEAAGARSVANQQSAALALSSIERNIVRKAENSFAMIGLR